MGAAARRARRRASGTLTLTMPGSAGGRPAGVAGSLPVSRQAGGWPARLAAARAPSGGGAGAGRAAAASSAWAHMDSTVWRQKEHHSLTWCWSRPVWPLPCWWHSSAGHLFPVTVTRAVSVAGRPCGTWQ